MSSDHKVHASGDDKSKRKKSREPKRIITPEKMVFTINQQNAALNNIIKKFSGPAQAKKEVAEIEANSDKIKQKPTIKIK